MNEVIIWNICYLYSYASLGWLVYSNNHRGTLGLEVPLCFYKYLILFFDIMHHADEVLCDHQLLRIYYLLDTVTGAGNILASVSKIKISASKNHFCHCKSQVGFSGKHTLIWNLRAGNLRAYYEMLMVSKSVEGKEGSRIRERESRAAKQAQ